MMSIVGRVVTPRLDSLFRQGPFIFILVGLQNVVLVPIFQTNDSITDKTSVCNRIIL